MFRKYFSPGSWYLVLLLARAVPIRNPFFAARMPMPSPMAIGPKKMASVRWERKQRNMRENCQIFLMVRLWSCGAVTERDTQSDRFLYRESLPQQVKPRPTYIQRTTNHHHHHNNDIGLNMFFGFCKTQTTIKNEN